MKINYPLFDTKAKALHRAISDLEERALITARNSDPAVRVAHIRQITDRANIVKGLYKEMMDALSVEATIETAEVALELLPKPEGDSNGEIAGQTQTPATSAAPEGSDTSTIVPSSAATSSTDTVALNAGNDTLVKDETPSNSGTVPYEPQGDSTGTDSGSVNAPEVGTKTLTLAERMASIKK